MSSLKEQAKALEIEIDGRWSDETLREKIDEAKKAKLGNSGNGSGARPPNSGPAQNTPASAAPPVDDKGNELPTEATPKAIKAGFDLDEKTRLIITAETLGIEIDPDWDEDRLRGEIQMAREGRADLQVKGAVPPAEYADPDYDPATKADKEPYTLKRDYWDANGDRIEKGAEVHLSRTEARRLGRSVLQPKDDL